MKIVFFGGSFNPPHIGHTSRWADVLAEIQPDLGLIMPAYKHHKPKQLISFMASDVQRVDMCKLAFGDFGKTEISTLEIDEKIEYTIHTVQILYKLYNIDELWLCVGTDRLCDIDQWYDSDKLLSLCKLIAFAREDETNLEDKAKELKTEVRIIKSRAIEISSSELRNEINEKYLPPKVLAYIKENKLYKTM